MSEENNTLLDESLQGEQTAELEQQPEQPTAAELLKDPEVAAYIELQIKTGIAEALKGAVPKLSPIKSSAAEQAQFDKMSYKERLLLFNTNPLQYNKLAKRGN